MTPNSQNGGIVTVRANSLVKQILGLIGVVVSEVSLSSDAVLSLVMLCCGPVELKLPWGKTLSHPHLCQ